jgi:quercetin dioxygenase-like cupin family protein
LKRGASLPVHHHSYEQTTWIVEGECELFSQGTKYVVRAGDILIIPPNVPHEVLFTQDSINIDFFAPARQDWMDGTATYYKTAPEP